MNALWVLPILFFIWREIKFLRLKTRRKKEQQIELDQKSWDNRLLILVIRPPVAMFIAILVVLDLGRLDFKAAGLMSLIGVLITEFLWMVASRRDRIRQR